MVTCDLCQDGLTFYHSPSSNEGDIGVLDIGVKGYMKDLMKHFASVVA